MRKPRAVPQLNQTVRQRWPRMMSDGGSIKFVDRPRLHRTIGMRVRDQAGGAVVEGPWRIPPCAAVRNNVGAIELWSRGHFLASRRERNPSDRTSDELFPGNS